MEEEKIVRSVEEENIVRVCSLRLSRSVSVEEEKIGRVCPHRSVCGGEEGRVCPYRMRRTVRMLMWFSLYI